MTDEEIQTFYYDASGPAKLGTGGFGVLVALLDPNLSLPENNPPPPSPDVVLPALERNDHAGEVGRSTSEGCASR